MPTAASHPFYTRLNQLLHEHGFDDFVEAQCATFYAETMGRPSLPPGIYFGLLLIGYFEGIDSERGIGWRAADSLALRDFLGLPERGIAGPLDDFLNPPTHRGRNASGGLHVGGAVPRERRLESGQPNRQPYMHVHGWRAIDLLADPANDRQMNCRMTLALPDRRITPCHSM